MNALATGQVAHYYTDFGEPQLANQSAVTVTPHIGGSTIEAEINGATQAARTIMTYLETCNWLRPLSICRCRLEHCQTSPASGHAARCSQTS
ncbi:hypothetical protein WP50_12555, partial [Lactiplantibacillus plantarum]